MLHDDDQLEVERALRRALWAVEEGRAEVLRHAATAYALADELRDQAQRPPDAPEHGETGDEMDARLSARAEVHLEALRHSDAVNPKRLQLGDAVDKYAVSNQGPPCLELIPICGGRCCKFDHALSSQDLDEGVIAWDRGKPYLIRHREDGFCTHSDPVSHGCTVYQHRPALCRTYDCRNDKRIWIDYEARILAPLDVEDPPEWGRTLNLLDRLRRRDEALAAEAAAVQRLPRGPTR